MVRGESAGEDGVVGLVLSDVDGTLLTHDRVLSERAIAAVGRLREAGILFAIVSGRPPRGLSTIKEALPLTTPLAGFNGGAIVNPDGSSLSSHRLAADDAKTVIRTVGDHGLDVWLYTDTDWLVADAAAAHVAKEQRAVGFAPAVSADFAPHLDRAVKIVGVSDDSAQVAGCEESIWAWGGGRVSARRSQSYDLDITHPEATKGHVLTMLSACTACPRTGSRPSATGRTRS